MINKLVFYYSACIVSLSNLSTPCTTLLPQVGKKVMAAASEKLTPVTLELGGKDAFIVCEDADLKQVRWWAASAACFRFKKLNASM